MLSFPCVSPAISPVKIAGAVEGRVSDDHGYPQMGAAVQIFDREDKLVDRASTDQEGLFVFAGLLPDVYSIRVTLATFLPAFRSHIQVDAGKSNLLDVSLSGLFSYIRMLPRAGTGNGQGADDWKWVLRSSSSTRPIFRYLPADPSDPGSTAHAAVFSDTRGIVRFSAGDANASGATGEVGTAFAFATNVYGSNNVQFVGDVGYGATGETPSASIRTTYSREIAGLTPEISVTARQLYIPRWSASFSGSDSAAANPPLRSLGMNVAEKTRLSDSIELAYGAGFDSIAFIDQQHYFSPYARLTWNTEGGRFDVTYSSGNARPELGFDSSADANAGLQRDVVALESMPAVTLNGGRSKVQEGQDIEIAWSKTLGSREIRVSGYRESVQNAALMISGNPGDGFTGDLIPDLYTDSLLFDIGNYHTAGYTTSLTQHLGDNYQLTVAYGSLGVIRPTGQQLETSSPQELRGMIRGAERQAVTAIAVATLPVSGTRLTASYQFMNDHDAMVAREYSTDLNQPQAGLNFSLRQPVPMNLGLPCRMELDAELQNMLAEGYLPISLADGRRLVLVHNPRIVRGGVNFRF